MGWHMWWNQHHANSPVTEWSFTHFMLMSLLDYSLSQHNSCKQFHPTNFSLYPRRVLGYMTTTTITTNTAHTHAKHGLMHILRPEVWHSKPMRVKQVPSMKLVRWPVTLTDWVSSQVSCFIRDAGYVRLCDRIFCQNPHITYFSAYNIIFRIAYAKIMLHMQKFSYIRIYVAYFRICNRIFQHFLCPMLFQNC